MAGIYIHIPFCSQFCIYCDFYSTMMLGKRESFTKALITEIGQRANDFNKLGDAVNTIYFGGGTPSLLAPPALQSILQAIYAGYNLGAAGGPAAGNPVAGNPVAGCHPANHPSNLEAPGNHGREVTLEVNPDDITEQYLQGLLEAGFNRLSMGIQSFNDGHLKWMNRRHTSAEAVAAFTAARSAGFGNISIDLIFGFEGLSMQMWQENLNRAIELSPEHISAYQLSVEPGTKLHASYKKGEYLQMKDTLSYKQYALLQKMLSEAGYVQYEISSFCKPGRESRHNSSYWDFTPYFGFGPSAHSFDGERRFWNVSSLNTYLKAIEQGTGCSREEIISPKDRFNEYIMLSLRRVVGMDVAYINSHFKVPDEFYNSLAVLIKRGDVVEQGGKLRVPPEKLFLSDGIIRELFCTGSIL
ncbi:MAG: coproporphyrinogen III oxidase [Bacteroidetes bacterium HGW-Bacteroidetes-8]|nr:MAG: coproporphyrinogen III oxidase [Bacteroidetes bacterium HGW-Bacteroidetes-8]